MAETEVAQPTQQSQNETTTAAKKPTTFSIWPPAQRTRDAVTSRLIETLSSPSVLSKRYGTVSHEEATELAKRIEEEAFSAATSSASPDDDGIEILQVYSKEISKRTLDAAKARSGTSPAAAVAASILPVKEEEKVPEESAAEEAAGDATKSEE